MVVTETVVQGLLTGCTTDRAAFKQLSIPLNKLPCDIARRAHKRQMAREAVEKIANQYFPVENQNLQTRTTIKSTSKSEFVNLAFETEEEVMPRTRSINNVE